MDQANVPPASAEEAPREVSVTVGVVMRRRPGVTRWAKWAWQAVGIIPGAADGDWRVLREGEDGTTDFFAGTMPLTLHRSEVEAYKVSLAMRPPSVFVILRENPATLAGLGVHAVTASAYEAQDYTDSGEELVEPVAMPQRIVEFVSAFANAHYVEVPFVKRRRDRKRVDLSEEGIGDRRIRQAADVYRAPGAQKPTRDEAPE